MTTTPTAIPKDGETPRCDAVKRWVDWNGGEFQAIQYEDAQEIERDLIAAQAALAKKEEVCAEVVRMDTAKQELILDLHRQLAEARGRADKLQAFVNSNDLLELLMNIENGIHSIGEAGLARSILIYLTKARTK